jgi:quercetin dioxygenase-like cupin family protein
MKIIHPDSKEINSYTGPGGYSVELIKINIEKMIDVFGFHDIYIPKGSFSSEHYHQEFIELFYLLTPARIKINGDKYKLPAKSMVVLQPGDRHEVYADEEGVRLIALKLPYIEADKVMTNK